MLHDGQPEAQSARAAARTPVAIVLMGVAGSGKTTIGEGLSRVLGWRFRDGDEFHPPENIAKMTAGIPLNDEDRRPWLAAIRAHLEASLQRGESTIVACSALREDYRRMLRAGLGDRVKFVHLSGRFDLIHERLQERKAHFMRPEMLRSQFETLEPPADAITVDVAQPPDAIVAEIRAALSV